MLMQAELQVFDAKGSPVHGDYTLDWVSPSKWREEIRFGQYERLRVGDAKGYWQTTGLSYQPQIIFQLDTLLHLKRSEEHTSELQSHHDLVCRPLLEKKNKARRRSLRVF